MHIRVLPKTRFSWYNVVLFIFLCLLVSNLIKCIENTFSLSFKTDRKFWILSLNIGFLVFLSKSSSYFAAYILILFRSIWSWGLRPVFFSIFRKLCNYLPSPLGKFKEKGIPTHATSTPVGLTNYGPYLS